MQRFKTSEEIRGEMVHAKAEGNMREALQCAGSLIVRQQENAIETVDEIFETMKSKMAFILESAPLTNSTHFTQNGIYGLGCVIESLCSDLERAKLSVASLYGYERLDIRQKMVDEV